MFFVVDYLAQNIGELSSSHLSYDNQSLKKIYK